MDKSLLRTRRDTLKGLLATGFALKLGGCGGNDSSTVAPTSIMTSQEAFAELDNGNGRFVARNPRVRDTAELDRVWTANRDPLQSRRRLLDLLCTLEES